MQVGLFFGSFNPVHTGHLIIANYVLELTHLDQVWMMISPHNPLKDKKTLLDEYDRYHLVELATDDNPRIIPSDFEFKLPQPSYTIDTLTHLKDQYKDHSFTLIMGGDNLASLHKWKNYEMILEQYHILVYQRPGYADQELASHPNVKVLDVPLLNISASFIRKSVQQGLGMRYFLPDKVWDYIDRYNLFK